jgi:hypothetical protein
MNKPKSAETKTQAHRQPNHHQKINKGDGRAMENRGRERRKEGEHSGENGEKCEEREKNRGNEMKGRKKGLYSQLE